MKVQAESLTSGTDQPFSAENLGLQLPKQIVPSSCFKNKNYFFVPFFLFLFKTQATTDFIPTLRSQALHSVIQQLNSGPSFQPTL